MTHIESTPWRIHPQTSGSKHSLPPGQLTCAQEAPSGLPIQCTIPSRHAPPGQKGIMKIPEAGCRQTAKTQHSCPPSRACAGNATREVLLAAPRLEPQCLFRRHTGSTKLASPMTERAMACSGFRRASHAERIARMLHAQTRAPPNATSEKQSQHSLSVDTPTPLRFRFVSFCLSPRPSSFAPISLRFRSRPLGRSGRVLYDRETNSPKQQHRRLRSDQSGEPA